MESGFNFYLPLNKSTDGNLVGIASTVSIDRDEERMSERALKMMVNDIKNLGVNLFTDHEHKVANIVGAINDAELIDSQVHVNIITDDPTTNPMVPNILNKLKRGIKLGLSVGGSVTDQKYEYSKELGKKIKVIDGVKLYEISVVGIPSNADAFVSIPNAIAKSRGKSCPCCYSKTIGAKCSVCFYEV